MLLHKPLGVFKPLLSKLQRYLTSLDEFNAHNHDTSHFLSGLSCIRQHVIYEISWQHKAQLYQHTVTAMLQSDDAVAVVVLV